MAALGHTVVVLSRIPGSNPQEPVQDYYPGDSLFTPFDRQKGLPIGNLTSQMLGACVFRRG